MVTRGFLGSRRAESSRVPPGQYVVDDFPVLTAGPTPKVAESDWSFEITDGVTSKSYDWTAFHELGLENIEVDIHCVTHWSKLGTRWSGVLMTTLFDDSGVTDLAHALVESYGGYTTNLPTEDLLAKDSMVATRFDDDPLEPSHGGPARLLVPHLYLWKSAKWVNRVRLGDQDEPGFWETAGYHNYGDPWREQRYFND